MSTLASLCLLGTSLDGAPSAAGIPQSTLNTQITGQAEFGGLTNPQRAAASPMVGAASIECESADHSVTGATDLSASPPEYATISAAVAAASSGDHICIGSGTWAEQLVISQALTLTGAGEEATIIQSPAALLPVCGTDLANYANTVAIVDICGSAANVSISGLTIDGDWDGAGPLSGMPASGRSEFFGLVVHGGASASISHLTATNIHQANSGSWGAQQGRAVWVGPGSTLSASEIHVLRFQKSGIFASGGTGALGAVATLNLSDSLVEGDQLAGMNSAIAMNGITIIGADATLYGVTSRGNKCDVASCSFTSFVSGGLLIYDRAGVQPAMDVSVTASIFQDNDWGVYTRVRKFDSSVEVNGNDISFNRYVGLEVNEGNASFANNDIVSNEIVGIEVTSGLEGVAPVQATFTRNLIEGNGGVHAASSAIRLVENPGYASRANLLFSSNAIIDNLGVSVAHISSTGAPLSTDDVIVGTGTWWGDSVQPVDASMSFTSNLLDPPDSLALDASDESYGFIVSSVAIESSVDLPPLTIASSDRTAMPTPISIDFGAISGGGTVTVVPSVQAAEGNISFGANPSVIDIDFTGTFTGSVEVCIGYDSSQYYAGSSILLFHYIGGAWVDVTSSVDESTRRVCGLVSSFSPFAAGEELAVYAITYDANEGTLAGGEVTSYTFGASAITEPADPTRTGYDFVGWFLDDGAWAAPAFPLTPIENTTVYAKWSAATYTITYDVNDGALAGGEDTSYIFGEVAISAPVNPTRAGYVFGGWYLDDGTFLNAAFPLTPTVDTSVHAKWTAISSGGGGGISGPVNLSVPTLSGYASVGSTMTVSPGTWMNVTTYLYHWYRCSSASLIVQIGLPSGCTFITRDVGASYAIQPADIGAWLRVQVRVRGDGGKASLFSATSARVGAKPVSINARPPRVIGFAAVGQTLTAKRGQWANGLVTYAYQWYSCTKAGVRNPRTIPAACTAITGATSKTYVVRAADRGSFLRVRVTATGVTGQGFRMSRTTGVIPN